jgi:hypothetical protein
LNARSLAETDRALSSTAPLSAFGSIESTELIQSGGVRPRFAVLNAMQQGNS